MKVGDLVRSPRRGVTAGLILEVFRGHPGTAALLLIPGRTMWVNFDELEVVNE